MNSNKSYTKDTTQLALVTDVDLKMETNRQPSDNQRLPQYNAAQDNTIQTNAAQSSADKPRGLNKKTYAAAVRADEKLSEKEQRAINRKTGKGYESFATVGETLRKKKT